MRFKTWGWAKKKNVQERYNNVYYDVVAAAAAAVARYET